VTAAGNALDELTHCVEYVRHRMVARHQFEESLLTLQQGLGPPVLVYVRLHVAPAGNTTVAVPERQTAYLKPPIAAVRAANAVLDVVWLPRLYRSPPCSSHRGQIIRMNNVTARRASQVLERCAKILQGIAVDGF